MDNQIKVSRLQEIFDNLMDVLAVRHLLCTSTNPKESKWNWKAAEAFLKKSEYNKLPVTSVILAHNIEIRDGQLTYHAFIEGELVSHWESRKRPFITELSGAAENGVNKYVLNKYFHDLFQFINQYLERLNINFWLEENDAANELGKIFVMIKGEYRSKAAIVHCLAQCRFEALHQ
jgi:hypothetical protein